jgi:hypothetical protein
MHAYHLFSLVSVYDAPGLFNPAVLDMVFLMSRGTLPVVLHELVLDSDVDAPGLFNPKVLCTLFLF